MINILIVIHTTLTKNYSKKHHVSIIFFIISLINWKYYEVYTILSFIKVFFEMNNFCIYDVEIKLNNDSISCLYQNKSNLKHNICKIKHIFMNIIYTNGYNCIYMSIIKSNYM